MSKLQNQKKLTPFIDYIPAELKENKTWEIVYYAVDPFESNIEKRLKRKRNRVKPMKNITERRKYAKRIIAELNNKLRSGWSPFIAEQNTKSFAKLNDVIKIFLEQTEQQIKKGVLRPDTLRAYKSYTNNFKIYLKDINKEDCFVNSFDENLCRGFLDVIFYDRKNSARTHNNYLTFIGVFSRWMIKRKYINIDFAVNISKIKESDKIRIIIPKIDREKIFNHLKIENKNYHALCLTTFYCFIRRTELTKLRVSDVILSNGIISIPAEVSKNNKSQIVTIPHEFIPVLTNHLRKAKNTDFLFSADNFKPGSKKLDPKKISDYWLKIRKDLTFNKRYQWYSLKDTGITNLLQLGIPPVDVRNQARHYSIKQTEQYIPKTILKPIGSIQFAKSNF